MGDHMGGFLLVVLSILGVTFAIAAIAGKIRKGSWMAYFKPEGECSAEDMAHFGIAGAMARRPTVATTVVLPSMVDKK